MKGRCYHVLLSYILLSVALAGCADPELDALELQLSEIHGDPGPVQPIELLELVSVPEAETALYQAGEHRSPFRRQLLAVEQGPADNNERIPDPNRARAPLEAYELAALRLAGILSTSGHTYGLIHAPDGEVHRVRLGDHLGRRHGRIVNITAASIQLVELVLAEGGGWVERDTEMSLE